MEKITNIFDRLNNTIVNHMEGKATDKDLVKIAYEVDKYLLENPHPHDLVKNNDFLHSVSDYYYLKDGDDVRNGDEYYDYDEEDDWVTIKDQVGTYKHDTETCYKTRRKV